MPNLQTAGVGVVVSLYEIDTSLYGGGIIRLTPNATEAREAIVFNGNTYTPFPIDASGFEVSGNQAPRPVFVVSNLQPLLLGGINQYRGLQNCKFTRLRVKREELDDINPSVTTDYINADVFYINKITRQTSIAIEFELITKIELANRQRFPRRSMIPYCNYQYRRWNASTMQFEYADKNGCPYTGGACFNKYNASSDPANDGCSKTLKGCEIRFGTALPFQGFPSFTSE